MARELNLVDKNKLEDLVDDYTLQRVLEALCDICHEKSEHFQTNWQDKSGSNYWFKLGGITRQAAIRVLAANKGKTDDQAD